MTTNTPTDRNHLQIADLYKRFGKTAAVNGVSLDIQRGELVTLLGPSGCGKTTTLQMIAGFHLPDRGAIVLNGTDITAAPAYQRGMPLVFQEYALFPHLSVFENIAFGLRLRKTGKQGIRDRVTAILNQLGLSQTADRFPNQLSGGQQQRIALARALVLSPEVLLLDEPLSNLDAKLRLQVRYEIKELRRQFQITALYVTHDQEEALSISDRIAVMNQGVVEQYGTPWEVYYRPKTEFVARFIGETNFLDVAILAAQPAAGHTQVRFRWRDREFSGRTEQAALAPDRTMKILLRPEALTLMPWAAGHTADRAIRGTIERSSFLGTITRYWLDIGGQELVVDDAKTAEHGPFQGDVAVGFSPHNLYFL